MSVLSAIAEHADLLIALQNPQLAESAAGIAGKFKVIRTGSSGQLDCPPRL